MILQNFYFEIIVDLKEIAEKDIGDPIYEQYFFFLVEWSNIIYLKSQPSVGCYLCSKNS